MTATSLLGTFHVVLVHPEVVGNLVPHRIRHDLRHVFLNLRFLQCRDPENGDAIREIPMRVATLKIGNPLVEPEERVVVRGTKPYAPQLLLGGRVFNEDRHVLQFRAEPLGDTFNSLRDKFLKG